MFYISLLLMAIIMFVLLRTLSTKNVNIQFISFSIIFLLYIFFTLMILQTEKENLVNELVKHNITNSENKWVVPLLEDAYLQQYIDNYKSKGDE